MTKAWEIRNLETTTRNKMWQNVWPIIAHYFIDVLNSTSVFFNPPFPTDPVTIWEPHNPSINQFYEALKLLKGRSGSMSSCSSRESWLNFLFLSPGLVKKSRKKPAWNKVDSWKMAAIFFPWIFPPRGTASCFFVQLRCRRFLNPGPWELQVIFYCLE